VLSRYYVLSEVRRERNLLSFFFTLSVKETNRGEEKEKRVEAVE